MDSFAQPEQLSSSRSGVDSACCSTYV
jgi:hypothetical protein